MNIDRKQISRSLVWGLFFLVILLTAFSFVGWKDAAKAASNISALNILCLCALSAAHYLIRALRWHIIVHTECPETRLGQNALHFFGGFAMTATPGRIGELIRLRWLSRDTGRTFGSLVHITLADRAIELASMVLLISVALASSNLGTSAGWWLLLVAGVLAWISCRPRLLEFLVVRAWHMVGWKPRLFVRIRRLIRRLRGLLRPQVLLPTLAIGILGWAFEGLAFWLLLGWLGADVSLWVATAIFLTAVLSGALVGLPGGLGGTEAAIISLLLLQGVPADLSVVATAIIRIVTLWFAVLLGFAILPVAEIRAGRLRQGQN